jgi:transposase-like protein
MTRKENNRTTREDGEFLRPLVHTVIQEFFEAEMAEAVGAGKGERVEGRLSYRSGYYREQEIPGGLQLTTDLNGGGISDSLIIGPRSREFFTN